MVECEDVELPVVAQGHLFVLCSWSGSLSLGRREPNVHCEVLSGRPPQPLVSPAVEHHFNGPAYTIGIEEELMILDAESLELVERDRDRCSRTAPTGEIKPELMESVLEISTDPCADLAEAGEQLRGAAASGRRHRRPARSGHRLRRHPSVRDVGGPADRRPARATATSISALRFVARQELIFGMHVHVGIDDPDKAIHVANGMRVHMPVLLALSANSPFWRADPTGLASTRTPIFRAFPRVGMPAHVQGLGGLRAPDRVHGRHAGDRGLHLPLVRRAPASELRHGRDAGDGLPDADRAHARAGGARPGDGA